MTSIIYQSLVFIYRFLPFKKQICDFILALGIPFEKFYMDIKFSGKFRVRMKGEKFFLFHHYHSTIENEIYWRGLDLGWEKETIKLWVELCKESKVIFDIGANTGVYALLGRVVNKDAQIISFEPSKSIFRKLQDNIQLNNFDIVDENIALSNKNGEQLFYDVKSEHQYSASLSPEKLKNFEGFSGELDEYMVKTQTLSAYIDEKGIKSIDLMKIDVEMHEPEVIEGFGKYLKMFKPTIFVEILTADIADKLNALCKDCGYLFYFITANSKPIKVPELSAGVEGNWNYLICEPAISRQLNL